MGAKSSARGTPPVGEPNNHRQPTGIPRLDDVLAGGIQRGSLVIIVGPPGSGKTTLANQIAFAAAKGGRRAITFTALSESTDKLAAHLRTFSFFDEQLLGDTVQFISLQQFLSQGLESVSNEVVAAARASRADMVVVDGFRGISGLDDDSQFARKFLYETGARLGLFGITLMITTEAEPRDAQFFPEATTADVIIGLHYGISGVRTRRAIEIIKARGSHILSGLHGLRLTPAGLIIYPRLEALVAEQQNIVLDAMAARELNGEDDLYGDEAALAPEIEADGGLAGRARFGLPELETLVGGGLTRGSSTVIIGSPGTGKTLLALQWALEGVRQNEPTVFVGLREDRPQLLRKADMFALADRFRAAIAPGGGLILQNWAPVEVEPDVLAARFIRAIERTGARRIVIDSIGEIERAVSRSGDPGRLEDYLAALQVTMREHGVTSLFVKESAMLLAPEIAGATEAIAVLAENVIYMQHVSYRAELHRVLSVVKMRFSAHDTSLREFTIVAPTGIRVLGRAQSVGGVLEGIEHTQEQQSTGRRDTSHSAQTPAESGTQPAEQRETDRGQRKPPPEETK